MDFALPLCGLFVGILIGVTGMGGGAAMTAFLIVLFGINPVSAVGTDLLFAAATKSFGAREHARRGGVDWQIVKLLALGSVPGTLVTMLVLSQIPVNDPALSQTIRVAIGAALLLSAVGFLVPRTFERLARILSLNSRFGFGVTVPGLTVALGFVLGLVVSLTSVGAGVIGLALLRQLYRRLPIVRLVGSDIAHAVPLTLIAGFGHWMLGEILWDVLLLLLLGSIPGVVIGSRLAHFVPEEVLRPAVGTVLLVLAGSMLLA